MDWISVKDKLPDTDEEVLAFIDSPIKGHQSVHVCFRDNQQRWRVSNYWEADSDIVEEEWVAFWLPIYEPEESKENDKSES